MYVPRCHAADASIARADPAGRLCPAAFRRRYIVGARMLFLSLPLSHRERCNSTQDMHPSGMHVHFRHAVFTVSPGVNDPAIPLLHRPQHVLSWSGRQVESTVIAVDMQLTRHVKQ